jgi:hypothetical protein
VAKAFSLKSVIDVHDPFSVTDDNRGADDDWPCEINRHVQQSRTCRAMLQHGQAALLQLLVLSLAAKDVMKENDLQEVVSTDDTSVT